MAQIIEGKKIAASIRESLKQRVERLRAAGMQPGLSVTLVGEDPASQVYVRNKDKAASEVGVKAWTHRLPADISEEKLREHLLAQNLDTKVHGILLQLPLPGHLPEDKLLDLVDYHKDVDGFHAHNLGNLMLGRWAFRSCTPYGVQMLLKEYGISPRGKHVVIVGRSNIVGKPLANLLIQKGEWADATLTVCHSRTPDLAEHTRRADILITAIGRPETVTGDMVREGVVAIDVGMNRVNDATSKTGYRLCGDMDFPSVSEKASYITPVPGGVGPMTIAMLLTNTIEAAERASGLDSELN